MGYGHQLVRQWTQKVAETNSVGLQAEYHFYFLNRLSAVQTQNLVQALQKAGVQNPTIRSGFREIFRHLWSIIK